MQSLYFYLLNPNRPSEDKSSDDLSSVDTASSWDAEEMQSLYFYLVVPRNEAYMKTRPWETR